MITIYFNNTPIALEKNSSLLEILNAQMHFDDCYSIVVNRHFVPRAHYTNTVLKEGDKIEMIMPMQGG